MKKLSILLGSLLIVGAVAQAKEVVAAPVVEEVQEVVVQPVELVEAPEFKPSGYVDLQYKYYGKTENAGNSKGDWNAGWNDKSRLQLLGSIKMTENQTFEYRVRSYQSLDLDTNQGETETGTETRLRYFYNHGMVDNTDISLVSRLQYFSFADETQLLEYKAMFEFRKYLPENVTTFEISPKYGYEWDGANNSDYRNYIGADLTTFTELPYGFSFEFNAYLTQSFYGQDQAFGGTYEEGTADEPTSAEAKKAGGAKFEDKNFTIDVEAYIYNTQNLYKAGNLAVDFNFEGGFDPATYSQHKKFNSPYLDGVKAIVNQNDRFGYSLYMLPNITADYKVTDNLKVYAGVGAEYRNWDYTASKSASTWRWQPQAWAGMKATF